MWCQRRSICQQQLMRSIGQQQLMWCQMREIFRLELGLSIAWPVKI